MKSPVGKPAKRHLRPRPAPRQAQWWAGVLTLLVVISAGVVLAMAVEWGLESTYPDEARVVYYFFFALSFVGLTAGALSESGGHGIVFHLVHQNSKTICVAVNATLYIVLILIWLKFHGDERLKK